MELIFTDAAKAPQGILRSFTLDMAYGSDENDFEIVVPANRRLEVGAYVYEHGTENGGIVDYEEYDGTGDVPVLAYGGRTWHGILGASIVKPTAGADYMTLSGELSGLFRYLIERQGLDGVFAAEAGPYGASVSDYRVPRYASLYEVLTRLASEAGKRLTISKRGSRCYLGAADVAEHMGLAQLVPLTISENRRPVNHLVLLGKGELAARLVRDVYADVRGVVSTVQTLFGADEVAQTYEMSSESDPAKLVEAGLDKLAKMQGGVSVSLQAPIFGEYEIGDVVQGVAPEVGMSAQAKVTKKVVHVSQAGETSVSYSVGEPTFERIN